MSISRRQNLKSGGRLGPWWIVICGGQGSFINDKLSRDYQLPRQPNRTPVSIVLADGSSSQAGLITQYNPLILCVAGNEEPISMDVAPTAHNIILSMPWPLIAEMLERIGRAKYFTKLDVQDGYHRMRIAKGEEWKTTFKCRYGLFKYTVMLFGLCNAPGTFQNYVNDTFHDFLNDFLIIYLDELVIYSDSLTEHKCHVHKVLEKLRDAKLCLKSSKCQFHIEEVAFLGFLVGPQGIWMDPAKVD